MENTLIFSLANTYLCMQDKRRGSCQGHSPHRSQATLASGHCNQMVTSSWEKAILEAINGSWQKRIDGVSGKRRNNNSILQTRVKPGAALQKPWSLIHWFAHPLWKYMYSAATPKCYNISKDIKLAWWVQSLQRFCWIDGFCQLVELHLGRVCACSLCNMLFTNSAPLGRVGHRVAMSVCLSVCAIAKHPLPEVV